MATHFPGTMTHRFSASFAPMRAATVLSVWFIASFGIFGNLIWASAGFRFHRFDVFLQQYLFLSISTRASLVRSLPCTASLNSSISSGGTKRFGGFDTAGAPFGESFGGLPRGRALAPLRIPSGRSSKGWRSEFVCPLTETSLRPLRTRLRAEEGATGSGTQYTVEKGSIILGEGSM